MSIKNPMGWTRDFHYWSVLVELALAGLTMYLFHIILIWWAAANSCLHEADC